MKPTRSATRPVETRVREAAGALLKGLTRLAETLGPQPQLQPVPVRVRERRFPTRP